MPKPVSTLWFSLALLFGGCATTTNPEPPWAGTTVPPGQDVRLAVYNVALGAVFGSVGALLNGDGDPALVRLGRGAGWGAAGGTVAYAGKWLAGEVRTREQLAYALPTRLTHDVGASIVQNASHDRPPLDRLAAYVGFVRLDVRPASGDVQARLQPVTAAVFASVLAGDNGDLHVGHSLAFGTPVFVGDGSSPAPIFGGQANGYGGFGTVYLNRESDDFYGLAAHELVHVFHHREMAYPSALYARLDEPLRRSGAYRAVARWVYLDDAILPLGIFYVIEGGAFDSQCYYDNWFEREAEAFGRRRAVGVCP